MYHFLQTSTHCRAFRLICATLLLLFSGVLWAESPAIRKSRFNLNGEYGLWVERRSDSLKVSWITATKGAGYLKAKQNDTFLCDIVTDSAQAHQASFASNPELPVELFYGSQIDSIDRQQTMVYPAVAVRSSVRDHNVDSLFVLGDLHGQYDILIDLLRSHGLIDMALQWSGDQRHLILLGDIFDRGHDVIKSLWFLYRLQREARDAGGRVEVVLGNHEIMMFQDDLRYTSGKEQLIARYYDSSYSGLFDRQNSVLGQWLATRPAMLLINGALMTHGGVGTRIDSNYTVESFNDSLWQFLAEPEFETLLDTLVTTVRGKTSLYVRRLFFFNGENSVFWFRNYLLEPLVGRDELTAVLNQFDAEFQVVAHTAASRIREYYDGKIVSVDLKAPATEMLLIVRGHFDPAQRFRCLLDGSIVPIYLP